MTDSSARVPVRRFGAGEPENRDDAVAVEAPLELRVRQGDAAPVSVSITLRTPGHDAELALGFLISEGMIRGPAEVSSVACTSAAAGDAAGDIVCVTLGGELAVDLGRLQRHFYATSSCGVCGRASLEALQSLGHPPIHANRFAIAADSLRALPAALAGRQSGFAATGGLHATALFDSTGQLLRVREDVGRHNATDKVIGAAFRSGELPLAAGGLLVSGRASFEILQKALMAGCPLVAAVGAPSSLAVEMAWEFGLTLVGFLRDGRFNVYANPGRVLA